MANNPLIFIGADHAGFASKEKLKSWLLSFGYDVTDMGTNSEASCHYPDYAKAVAVRVLENKTSRGILICGSGFGVDMMANRFKGIRAARCLSAQDAWLSRSHNDANVLCLGSRITNDALMIEITKMWLESSFEGGRHQLRVDMMDK
jgi:ribose 5-phosphate isomerase B